MPGPILPWMPSVFPVEIQNELNRRKINRSFKFVNNSPANWDKNGDWNTYRGPMVSWIRVCSNSAGHPLEKKERFVLYSGKGFYDTYGFSSSTNVPGSKQQVIGYTPGNTFSGEDAMPHIVENSLISPTGEVGNYPIHVPSPEISRLEVTVQKELLRRVQMEWVCFSWKQLQYMTPYFLVPGITCMVEWGWNHFNPTSLVDLGDISKMRSLWDNAYPLYDNIIKSNGNYDVIYGIITNFNWSVEGNKIICTTEITSKDRLYSGIAKDYGMTVNNSNDKSKDGVFKSIKDFINNKAVLLNLKSLVLAPPKDNTKVKQLLNIALIQVVKTEISDSQHDSTNYIWYDILNGLLVPSVGVSDKNLIAEQIGMRLPYVFGVFAGRPTDSYTTGELFGQPKANDFDYGTKDNDPSKFWINMGLVTAILNYFSARISGAGKGKNMFEMDIQNAVISGHPNLISCDPNVLIPNYQAPKFLWGQLGLVDNTKNASQTPDKESPYSYQVLRPTRKGIPVGNSLPNKTLNKTCLQPTSGVFRDDLDEIINYNRYRYVLSTSDVKYPISSYSFPSQFDSNVPLPISSRGLSGPKLEKDYSGLLSNIYISFKLFMDAINNDSNASFMDIYKEILQRLMDATGSIWDLSVVDVDGTMTITDKKFVGKYGFSNEDVIYSFDYMDADSIIKSLKFRPVLSDAQATRVIYGSVNNSNSKYQYIDKNDLLDYKFKDAVILPSADDGQNPINNRTSQTDQLKDLLKLVQTINTSKDDGSLQMTLNANRLYDILPQDQLQYKDMHEIIKLVLPNKQLLELLLNDEDYDNNPRYCAVQKDIIAELTLQGIGGLRTFQCFLIKNLPEPYSDRNVIFRVTDVNQTLEAGNWETVIRAQLSPLKGYITKRITGPLGASAPNNGWPYTQEQKLQMESEFT